MTQTTQNIAEALNEVIGQIRHFEKVYDRPSNSVQLLAVSKTKPISMIESAMAVGQHAFGENYPDEALNKIGVLGKNTYEWHFIGGIQSRKAAGIANNFDWVHSVDRLKVINKLASNRPSNLPPLNICLQVNIDNESSKSGASESELMELAEACTASEQLTLRGIMAIPAPRESLSEQRKVFANVRELKEKLQSKYATIDTLSMGMSGDLEAAIAEGATIVRIGTALFGSRVVQ